jgi:hypothetical protein
LTSPSSTTGRTLFLYGLLVQLRPLTEAAPRERPHLADLLDAIAQTIGQGRAARAPAALGSLLRDAAERLAEAAGTRNAIFLGDELGPITAALRRTGVSVPAPAPPVSATDLEPASEVVPSADDVVPIESLAPDDPEPVEIESLAPDHTDSPAREPAGHALFEESFSTYFRLTHGETAVAGAAAAPPAPIPAPADVVPIEMLLIRGRRALERADRVRRELSAALGQGQGVEELRPLVSELIDLVPLALEE